MADLSVLEFRAMGSPARIVIDGGPPGLAIEVRDLIWMLERRWSRFLETSEVAAINRAPGCVTMLSEHTFTLVSHAALAWEATGGLFNPLMLQQLETHGYRRPWQEATPSPIDRPVTPAADEPMTLYPEINAIRLPDNTRFDPGGIGKGLAVDLASDLCVERGAAGASVELGGDLRVHGAPWYGSQWQIGIANPFDPTTDIATFTPTAGAVTTSSTRKRRWTDGTRHFHHVLDPRTGYPSTSTIAAVTTCSSTAWWAEVAAKSAIIVGEEEGPAFLDAMGTPGAIVTNDGRVLTTTQQQGVGAR